jgi:hypothetical protein
MTVKSTAITDFFNNVAAAMAGVEWHGGVARGVSEKKLTKKT